MAHTEIKIPDQAGVPKSSVEQAFPKSQATRLSLGDYFVDIVPNMEGAAPVYHWVLQQVGSKEVVCLGQELTLSLAIEQARDNLEALAQCGKSRTHSNFYKFCVLEKQK
jgi:hypothetical protein